MASFKVASASGRRVALSKSKFTPRRSMVTATGQPSGPTVWPGCESGQRSSQLLTPSPSSSRSAQLGGGGGGGTTSSTTSTGAAGGGPSLIAIVSWASTSRNLSSCGAATLRSSKS